MVCEAMPCHKHDAQFTVFHPRLQIFGLQQSFNRSNFHAFLETWRAPALALQLTQRALTLHRCHRPTDCSRLVAWARPSAYSCLCYTSEIRITPPMLD